MTQFERTVAELNDMLEQVQAKLAEAQLQRDAMTDSANVMAADAAEFASQNPRAWAYLRLAWWLVSDCKSEIHLDLHQGTTPIEVVGYKNGRRTNVLYVGKTDYLPTAGEIETAIMQMAGPEVTLPEWFTAEWKAAVGFHRQMA